MTKIKYLLIAAFAAAAVCVFPAQALAWGWYDDPVDISKGTIQLSQTSYTYSGEAAEPDVTLYVDGDYVSSWRYDVSYSNNVNAGKATVTVTADDSRYTGSLSTTFTIAPFKVKYCDMANAVYNGKKRTPAIWEYVGNAAGSYVRAVKGRDYTIKAKGGCKKIGKYKVVIKFKGNFSGTLKKTFKVLPKSPVVKKTKTLSTSQISARWSKVKGVSGYKVYRWNAKKGKYTLYKTTKSTSCTISRAGKYDQDVSFYVRAYKKVGKKTYYSEGSGYGSEYLKLSKPAFSLKRTDFGRFEIRFKVSGRYQVQISSNKKFKDEWPDFRKEWKGYTDCLTCSNYDSGEKVYVRVRGYYYNKNGNLKVGPWSDVKAVTPY